MTDAAERPDMTREDYCGHGRTWDQDCPACEDVWRKDRIKDLHKRAARYGFRLVPVKLDENHAALQGSANPAYRT